MHLKCLKLIPSAFPAPSQWVSPSLSFHQDTHHFPSCPKLKPHSLLNFFLPSATLSILQIYNSFIEPLEINRIQIALPQKSLFFLESLLSINGQNFANPEWHLEKIPVSWSSLYRHWPGFSSSRTLPLLWLSALLLPADHLPTWHKID